MLYSTPSMYIDYINKDNITWSVKESDFFPYADGWHAYWTGYYTSRANLKGYVREMNALAHTVDKLVTQTLTGSQVKTALKRLEVLDDAYGIAQHHDAVAGTEKQAVAFDYAKRLSVGEAQAQDIIAQIISDKLNNQLRKELILDSATA